MFSGLIAHIGRVAEATGGAQGMRLVVHAPGAVADGVARGDSIAINGVCLTVVAFDADGFAFDVVPETVQRTGFDALRAGDPVNVELSLRLGDRLGGHLVYGHVDGNAEILAKTPEGNGHRLTVELPAAMRPYVVEKGYVTVDGVSLTVASVAGDRFTIALIPETLTRTTLGSKSAGARVNLEVDPVARYALGAASAYRRDDGAASADELAWAFEI